DTARSSVRRAAPDRRRASARTAHSPFRIPHSAFEKGATMSRSRTAATFPRLGFIAAILLSSPLGAAPPEDEDEGPVKAEVHLLTELNIVQVDIDTDTFAAWLKPAIGKVEQRFRDEKASRDLVVQVTLHREGPAEIAVAGRPEPSAEEIRALVEAMDA